MYVTTTTTLILIHTLILIYVGFAFVCFRLLGSSTLFPFRPFGFKQFCTLRLSDFETRFPNRPPPTPN